MNRDEEPIIHFEVIVPRIILPTPSGQDRDISQSSERVYIDPLPLPSQASGSLQGVISSYATQQGLFHLFRISNVAIPGKILLLRVLRPQTSHDPQREDDHALTDQLAFMLEYSHSHTPSTEAPLELIPGVKHVTIVYSEERLPSSYSVDGAEG